MRNPIRGPIRDPNCDPIRDPRSNPIRYGPDFVEAKLEQSRTNPVGCWVGDFDREPSALKTILIGIWRWLACGQA